MTDLTPPPATPGATPHAPQHAHQPQPAPAAPANGAPTENSRLLSRAVAITVAVLGAAALLISGTGTAFATIYDSRASVGESGSASVAVTGVTALDIDVARGDVSVEFADVREAELTYTGELRRWTLERSGDTLTLASPEWRLGWSDWRWFGGFADDEHAMLTLPRSLEGSELAVDLAAGRLVTDGEFGDVMVDMGAGLLEMEGTATSFAASIGAGRVTLDLADVQTADIELAAGYLAGGFTGEAPDRVDLDVSAGAVELRLPDEPYAVSIDRSAGSAETHNLETSSTSPRIVDITVSAGRVDLRAD